MKHITSTRPTKSALIKKRAELAAKGINLRELCESGGVSYQAARELLCGKASGRRGNSHKAAVFLGLKPNPEKPN
ncbi:DNA-binding protein [Sulfurimicrobium lacus]|uniref:DNA-binding protein n=1 Tax=Sulfurimicrobium lacus TaxID=2715678 RepID=A0A6F8VI21_9PROT|nr:DNA-binding protein [Sulfurimicrobium lacus]BCB28415.1 DNA-binding protein [Sulfurimicrobium lacus]